MTREWRGGTNTPRGGREERRYSEEGKKHDHTIGPFPCLVCPGVAVRAPNDTGDGRVRPDWPVHQLWAAGSGACLRTLRSDRRYERLDITGLTGATEAQRAALLALGAVDRST